MTRILSTAAAALFLATAGLVAVLPATTRAQTAAEDPQIEIVEMVQGAEDAPVTVMEYASFTCPHCANFHEGPYKQLKADYIDTGKVKFVFREVYFDKYGVWASMIARCAGPEKFFGITELMFKGQSEWARAGGDGAIAGELRKIGLLAGIENDALDACLNDAGKLRALVAWYQENATADDVSSTPTLFINGEKHPNMNYAELSALLDKALSE
ncbi:DsbA family protein [Primorskyibacter flagellatus]|uniref:DsbA family protein n=1 Tax=Primorskyibacter flagellatus TaxID=1387277 RepID=UPI003A8F42D3